jgi:hypothetical protein
MQIAVPIAFRDCNPAILRMNHRPNNAFSSLHIYSRYGQGSAIRINNNTNRKQA